MTVAVQNEMLDIAVAANGAGLCVLPPKQDGSKRPLKAWEQYANTSSTIEEVQRWYSDHDGVNLRTGIGIVLGAASGGLECFEFDDLDAYRRFLDAADDAGLTDLVRRIENGYLESSPNGIHWLYRCERVAGNTKLAQRREGESYKVLIETRGQGGYAIIAPSHGDVHPSGRPYRLLSGGFDKISTITPEERDLIWELARSLDEIPEAPPTWKEDPAPGNSAPKTGNTVVPGLVQLGGSLEGRNIGERPGDWFNRVKTWPEVLEPAGWTHIGMKGEESLWRRPGKDRDHSATTGFKGNDVLKVFSSSTPFDTSKSYTKFAAYAVLAHGGDFGTAARVIFPEMPKENRHLELVASEVTDTGRSEGEGSIEEAPAVVGSSWQPMDLSAVLTGETSNMNQPTVLAREDGMLLLYPGCINEFKGLPESGKGWMALNTCRQEMNKGNAVVYIDLEDHAEGIVERLLALGVSHEVIEQRFLYVHPDEPFGTEASTPFFAMIRGRAPTLVVIDSVAEIMASNGMDPLSNKDVAEYVNLLPRPLTLCGPGKRGPAVVVIDHLTKQNDNTRYSIGAQHKLAAIDGASYVIEAEQPFGRGRKGSSRVAVVKDRAGHIRRYAEGGRYVGRLTVHANDSGTYVDCRLDPMATQTIEGMEATGELMGPVAAYIESQGRRAPTTNEIRQNVEGRNEVIDMALETLSSAGFLFKDRNKGRGGGYCYLSLKPYEGD